MTLLSLVLAPLLPGVINRVKAWFAGRTGPPLLQLYWELARLLRKGRVLSRTTGPLFTLSPAAGLAAMLLAMCLVPLGAPSALHFPGDGLVLVGLLAMTRFFTVLAAMDTGSSFEGMGASREVAFGALAEPGLLLALGFGVVQLHSLPVLTSMSDIAMSRTMTVWFQSGPLALVSVSLCLLLLAENSRIPVDDPNTHLELTMIHEVMVLDHSGPSLAYILYGSALKLWIFASLLVNVMLPLHCGSLLLDGLASLGAILGVGVVVGVIESVSARAPMQRVPHFLATATALATLALMMVVNSR